MDHTDLPASDALVLLARLVKEGAEIEQRGVDGTLLFQGPVARDALELERSHDDTHWLLRMRPLHGIAGIGEDGRPIFDDNLHIDRTLYAARFDRLGDGNVGIAHAQVEPNGPFGSYSVVRIAAQERVPLIDAWDAFTAPFRHTS